MTRMDLTERLRLGVNIDHVATVRNARGSPYPETVRAALAAAAGGADGITAHLREDRRHIRDEDIYALKSESALPLNLEMAATDEMRAIALDVRPHACCLVPEKRAELTTEGGLDVAGQHNILAPFVRELRDAGIRVSLFVEPDARQLEASQSIGAQMVELHTGPYCDAVIEGDEDKASRDLERLREGAARAHGLGLEVHAGHGITFETVGPIAAIPELKELNIGHFLVAEALFTGLEGAVAEMRRLMDEARSGA